MANYVLGVDYGSDSVRTVLVNATNGNELVASVFNYPRWAKGLFCDPEKNIYRQHPLDYVEGLEFTIKECVAKSNVSIEEIKGLSVDTTGSTPVAVNSEGLPLALTEPFKENPNAMFVLWKDHSATLEASLINEHASKLPINYLKYVGGIYSSEWFWAKLLHILKQDEAVRESIASWVEHCDWIPFLLTGGKDVKQIKRGVCSAGHKALWAADFGGLPPNDFFSSLDPLLDGFTEKLFTQTFTADKPVGTLSPEWATRLGLTEKTVVGIGAFDAHMGAVGGQIEPYCLTKVMGTSTCDMMVVPTFAMNKTLVKGICGQVDGSIIPGMIGLEAGQSAFGDAYAWFKNLISYPLKFISDNSLREQISSKILNELSVEAEKIQLDEDDELAVDWFNGRRTPDANQLLKGAFTGLNLASDAPRLFRAVAEATCFGAKAIVERFASEKILVRGLIGLGGVAKKSPYIMQMMADVMNMPVKIHKSEQTCAAGAAMFAATAAGIYNKVEDAMDAMGAGFDVTFYPDAAKNEIYNKRYKKYLQLGGFLEKETSSHPFVTKDNQ